MKEFVYALFYLAVLAVFWLVVSEALMFKRLKEIERHRGHYLFSGFFWRLHEAIFVFFGNYHKKDKRFTGYVKQIRFSVIVIIILVVLILLLGL